MMMAQHVTIFPTKNNNNNKPYHHRHRNHPPKRFPNKQQHHHHHQKLMQKRKHDVQILYNAIIRSYGRCCTLRGIQSIQELIQRMECGINIANPLLQRQQQQRQQQQQQQQQICKIYPDTVTYSSYIHSLADAANVVDNVGGKAECILLQMEEMERRYHRSKQGRKRQTRIVLEEEEEQQYIQQQHIVREEEQKRHKRRMTKTVKWVVEENDEKESSFSSSIGPNVRSYNGVLTAYARMGGMDGAKNAQRILSRMEARYNTKLSTIRPNVVSYAIACNAWSKSGLEDEVGQCAQDILNQFEKQSSLEKMEKKGEEKEERSRHAFSDDDSMEYFTNNENILEENDMEANTILYNSVIDAWSRSNDPMAGEHALTILEKMKSKTKSCDDSDENIVCCCQPDVATYACVIRALSNGKTKWHAEMAEQLLEDLEVQYEQTLDKTLLPNAGLYNGVMHSWAMVASRCNDAMEGICDNDDDDGDYAPRQAERILRCMMNEELSLNNYAALGNTGSKTAAATTKKVLSTKFAIQPNIVGYNTVINAWAASTYPQKALEARRLLEEMINAINSQYNKSDDHDDAEGKSFGLIKPDIVTYNTVLNACASSTGTMAGP
eukprot:15326235-Ditylum_brightwellii.AAC.1